jgi:hypothetical protein
MLRVSNLASLLSTSYVYQKREKCESSSNLMAAGAERLAVDRRQSLVALVLLLVLGFFVDFDGFSCFRRLTTVIVCVPVY